MSGRTRALACPERPCSKKWCPVRMCVGCRARATKDDLLRVAMVQGRLVPDPRGTLPGRGAHLHPDEACVDLAVRRRAFPRAFRVSGPLDLAAVRAWVEQCSSTQPPRQRG